MKQIWIEYSIFHSALNCLCVTLERLQIINAKSLNRARKKKKKFSRLVLSAACDDVSVYLSLCLSKSLSFSSGTFLSSSCGIISSIHVPCVMQSEEHRVRRIENLSPSHSSKWEKRSGFVNYTAEPSLKWLFNATLHYKMTTSLFSFFS